MNICVCQIVKNEHAVIERCLQSVLPYISSWAIVDTGSTDGTQEIIKNFFEKAGVKGKLEERPWVHFEHNRNEALEVARSLQPPPDYILVIDADEVLVLEDATQETFTMPLLTADGYYILTRYGGTEYQRLQLIKASAPWKWEGVLHEVLVPSVPGATVSRDLLKGLCNVPRPDGARSSDPQKYVKDFELLKKEMQKNPTHSRNCFYCAQSARDAGLHADALQWYRKRIELAGDFQEETYVALVESYKLEMLLKKPEHEALQTLYTAYGLRPSRPEALFYLANHFRLQQNNMELCYLFAKLGVLMRRSSDVLFLQRWIYDWGFLMELSACCYWSRRYIEGMAYSRALLRQPEHLVPDNVRQTARSNIQFYNTVLPPADYLTLITNQLVLYDDELQKVIPSTPQSKAVSLLP